MHLAYSECSVLSFLDSNSCWLLHFSIYRSISSGFSFWVSFSCSTILLSFMPNWAWGEKMWQIHRYSVKTKDRTWKITHGFKCDVCQSSTHKKWGNTTILKSQKSSHIHMCICVHVYVQCTYVFNTGSVECDWRPPKWVADAYEFLFRQNLLENHEDGD